MNMLTSKVTHVQNIKTIATETYNFLKYIQNT